MPKSKSDNIFAHRDICAKCGHAREFHFAKGGGCAKQLKPIAGSKYCKCKGFVESDRKS